MLPGEVVADPDRSVRISSTVPGRPAQSLGAEAKALAEQLAAVGAGGGGGAGVLLNLRAPIAGVVVKRDAVVGQPVTAAPAASQTRPKSARGGILTRP